MKQQAPLPAGTVPDRVYRFLVRNLRNFLPPTTIDGTAEAPHPDFARTLRLALSLAPATLEEADIAVQYLACSSMALMCLELSRRHSYDEKLALTCSRRAASCLRTARTCQAALLRAQTQRRAREAAEGQAAPQRVTQAFDDSRVVPFRRREVAKSRL